MTREDSPSPQIGDTHPLRPDRFATQIRGYALGISALLVAMALHWVFAIVWNSKSPGIFFFYLMAILIGAWYGYGSGILNVLLVATCVPFLFIPGFSLQQLNLAGLVVLLGVSAAVSRTAQSRRRTEARLRRLNEDLDSLVAEQTAALLEANTSLKHRLAEIETLYSKLSVGLCFVDIDLNFVRVNESLAAIGGVPADSHIGRPLRAIFDGPFADVFESLCAQVIATKQPVLNHDLRDSGPSIAASGRDWTISCSPVYTGDGAVVGVQAIVQDITERKRTERELQRINRQLTKANEDLEQFAYSASHDLQEPLRMVSIYSQMLKRQFDGQLGPVGGEYINHTIQGATRMAQLVRDLLAYLHTSVNPEPAPWMDANAAVQAVLKGLEVAIAESGGVVLASPLPRIRMHSVHLEQVLQNLIGNALKYRGNETPHIFVSCERSGNEWRFSVADNGIGIAPEYKEQIFGIFKRLHSASAYPGTGMGLAICRRVVLRYGGQIWVESEPGDGSTFYFTVPDIEVPC
jgi:PAS domain S-box-containing protein